MAIAFTVAGTLASAIGATITPGLPAGFAADDIFVCVCTVEASGNTITFPAGWTKKVDFIYGTSRHIVAYRRAVAGDSGPAISGASIGIGARISGFSGAVTSGDPFDASGSQSNASSVTITAPTITPINANDMILFAGAIGPSGTATISGYSGTNPTFTEATDDSFSGDVNPLGVFIAYGLKTDTSATGARTATATLAGQNAGSLLSMTPAGAATIPSAHPMFYNMIRRPGSLS